MTQPTAPFKAGFVALIGRPNVGKSTLLNQLLGQKIAAVSPRAQTTRKRQLGILTNERAQVVFVDTPGLHVPVHRLGEYMNQVAEDALADADVIVWMIDLSEDLTDEDRLIAARLNALPNRPVTLLALNKADRVLVEELPQREQAARDLLPSAEGVFTLSAMGGHGSEQLLEAIIARLPESQPYYDSEQVTDLYERDIAADLIREATLIHLRDEVPHCIAVRVDEYSERSESTAYIAATLFVEKESQKGIVIGQGAAMLKRIGTTARASIEEMSQRKVFLELRVKVSKNWREDPDALRLLGFERPAGED